MSDVSEHSNLPTTAVSAAVNAPAVDLNWVWKEVGKRVFIKLDWSTGVADALEAAVPIILDGDVFVVGLTLRDFPLAYHLNAIAVHNTIENILRQAAGKKIRFEVIEGTSLEDWQRVLERRSRAQEAVVAMASRSGGDHHLEDLMNQIVGEIRHRVSQVHDRMQPQARAILVLDVAASLADAQDMLFPEEETRETRRAMSRVIDRVANFIEVPAITLAIEVERYHRAHGTNRKTSAKPPTS